LPKIASRRFGKADLPDEPPSECRHKVTLKAPFATVKRLASYNMGSHRSKLPGSTVEVAMHDSIAPFAPAKSRRSSGVMRKTWPAIAIALGLTLSIVRVCFLGYELIKDNLGRGARERLMPLRKHDGCS
jgi:hypothetical protein